MKTLNIPKFITVQMSVEEVVELKAKGKIKLDDAFQLGTDKKGRWDKTLQSKFMASVIREYASMSITVVEVDKALEYCKENGTCLASIDYFEKAKADGYEWVSLDGNNRTITLRNFLDNLVSVPIGDYPTRGGMTITVKPGKNKFKELNPILKKQILETTLNVTKYQRVFVDELNLIFRALNTQAVLNGQQFRNSYTSEFAADIRSMRDRFKNGLTEFISPKDFDNLKGDELLAKCITYVCNDEWDKKILDKVYFESCKNHKGYAESLGKAQLHIKNSDLRKLLDQVFYNIAQGFPFESKNSAFDYFCNCYNLYKRDIKIKKPEEYYELWLECALELFQDTDKLHNYEKKPGVKVSETFREIIKHPYKNALEFRQDLVRKKIEKKAFKNKYLEQLESGNSYFDWIKKIELYYKTDRKFPNGEKINPRDINNGNIIHGDHIIPLSKPGGETTIKNGQLLKKEDNWKKSNKLIEGGVK